MRRRDSEILSWTRVEGMLIEKGLLKPDYEEIFNNFDPEADPERVEIELNMITENGKPIDIVPIIIADGYYVADLKDTPEIQGPKWDSREELMQPWLDEELNRYYEREEFKRDPLGYYGIDKANYYGVE